MRKSLFVGLAALPLLWNAPSLAAPAGNAPASLRAAVDQVIPAAMCGRTCERGGRYIPGPPSVCYERDLEYCGSSRAQRGPGVELQLPGGGSVGIGDTRRDCRTVTIERDDGSVRRIRRCD